MDMIMNVNSHRSVSSANPYRVKNMATPAMSQDLLSENQMLADLIQQHSQVKQKHKASVPIHKLMKRVARIQKTNRMQRGEHQLDMIDSMGTDPESTIPAKLIDSMFQGSNHHTHEQHMQPRIFEHGNILYQDNDAGGH